MKDLIFYMYFELEDKHVGKGFIVYNVPFEDEDQYEIFLDIDLEDDLAECEEYGVHDFGTSPTEDVWGIGYGTYEVEEDKIDELMEKWHNTLKSHLGDEISPVVKFDERKEFTSIEDIPSDSEVYNWVKDKV